MKRHCDPRRRTPWKDLPVGTSVCAKRRHGVRCHLVKKLEDRLNLMKHSRNSHRFKASGARSGSEQGSKQRHVEEAEFHLYCIASPRTFLPNFCPLVGSHETFERAPPQKEAGFQNGTKTLDTVCCSGGKAAAGGTLCNVSRCVFKEKQRSTSCKSSLRLIINVTLSFSCQKLQVCEDVDLWSRPTA